MSVGIERMAVHLPPYVLDVAALAAARGVDPVTWTAQHDVHALRAVPPCEDATTMAATAGARVMRAAALRPDDVGLVLVASAAGTLRAPVVHELLQLGHHCRMASIGPGGHASTAALMAAADWVRAARGRQRKALVIAADVVRHAPGDPLEPTSGAGAVGIVVGQEPWLFQLAEESGTWAGRDDGSERAWLEAVEGTLGMLRPLERPEPTGDEVFMDRFARTLYQASSPAAARRAHRRLLDVDWRANDRRWAAVVGRHEDAVAAAVAEQVEPGLELLRQTGDCGAATPYLALAALLEADARRLGGRRVAVLACGGGCAELFSGLVSARAHQQSDAGVRDALASADPIGVAAWEALVDARPGGVPPPHFRGEFVRGADGAQHRAAP